MFSSTRCQHVSNVDVESEEALEAAKECLSSFSLQVLLGLKFHKSPEEIQRELRNTIALYSVTQNETYEEDASSHQLTDSLSSMEGVDSIPSERSYSRSSGTQRPSDEDRANAASHLFQVLKSLQFRKFPSERIVAKVRKISD